MKDHASYREEIVAKVAATDRKAEALGIDVRLAVAWSCGCHALRRLTHGTDDEASKALAKLDADQLRLVERAAYALSLLAWRLQSDEHPVPNVPGAPRASQAPTGALSVPSATTKETPCGD